MPRRVIERQLVCSECGKPLKRERLSAAAAEDTAPYADDEIDEAMVPEENGGRVETLVEKGPVCARCAEMR